MKNESLTKNKLVFASSVVLSAIITAYMLYPKQNSNDELDAFAQCLADKGAVMYGADWCPHCHNEKQAFGDSFRLVPYVECPDNPQKCLSAGINVYPTWIFPDGKKLVGEQGIKKLSQESGCPIIKN